jgi:hypothetical protein
MDETGNVAGENPEISPLIHPETRLLCVGMFALKIGNCRTVQDLVTLDLSLAEILMLPVFWDSLRIDGIPLRVAE